MLLPHVDFRPIYTRLGLIMNQMIFLSNFKFKHRQQWVANRPSSLHSKGPRGWWRLCSGSKWQDKKQYAQKDRKIHFHIIRNFCTVGMIKHTSTGCPESLLSLHPWRCLKSDWTQHWLMCCSRLGFEQSRLLCLQRCLPTSSVLCFLSKARFPECASVLTDANWSLHQLHWTWLRSSIRGKRSNINGDKKWHEIQNLF